MPKLAVRGLSKFYGAVAALRDATLSVGEGEFLSLLGPSGSGKTTLLMSVAGLIETDAGVIEIDGRDATHLAPYERDVGMVFQNYALFPHLSVFENVAFPLRMRRSAEPTMKAEVERALELVGLAGYGARAPQALSGGQQQRIALARCLVYRPSMILMDEPLGALDRQLRQRMQFEIRRITRQAGAAVLYVTHDQEEALVMSDRICLMNEARIVQVGTPHDLYFHPQSLFAAQFLGESNQIATRIEATDGTFAQGRAEDGALYRGRAAGDVAVGMQAVLVVRPEHLRVAQAGGGENLFAASIEERVLTGAVSKIVARLGSGVEIVAASLARRAEGAVVPGQSVVFGFDAEDAVMLPVASGA